MKRICITALLLMILYNSASAFNKEQCEEMITKAEAVLKEVDENKELYAYIPFDIYSEALINIIYARNQLDNMNYKPAYFYAAVSIIKFDTAVIFAKARKCRYEALLLEKDASKKEPVKDETVDDSKSKKEIDNKLNSAANSSLSTIIDANLFKKGPTYRIQLLDKNIFIKNGYTLTSIGKDSIDKIIKVLNSFPDSKIKIIGHTSRYDYKQYSKYKAKLIEEYMIKNGIDSNRITATGIGNRVVMDTPLGFRRINRIEILITDIN